MFDRAKEAKEMRQAPAMAGIPTWQYQRVMIGGVGTSADILNGLGADGWEVCGVLEDRTGTQVLLKRQSGVTS